MGGKGVTQAVGGPDGGGLAWWMVGEEGGRSALGRVEWEDRTMGGVGGSKGPPHPDTAVAVTQAILGNHGARPAGQNLLETI